MSDPPIRVESLTKRFGAICAVDDLTFEARQGMVTGFLGRNGSGKTSTLRVLLGLSQPTSGAATLWGRRYRELADPLRAVGAVLEGATFHPGRSGRDHLRAIATGGGIMAPRIDQVLDLVELEDAARDRVGSYSLGMRQRLGLAAAMLGDPAVLVLDEPANGLDPEGIRWLRGFLRRLAGEGRTVLMSSHVLSEVAQAVDDVVVIARGRLVTQEPLSRLTAQTRTTVCVRSPDADQLAALLGAQGLPAHRAELNVLTVPDASTETVGALAAAHGVVVEELRLEGRTLEEAYLELTAAAEREPERG